MTSSTTVSSRTPELSMEISENRLKKKYVLHKASAGPRPVSSCAFFQTRQGCKKGDNCPFKHEKTESDIVPTFQPDQPTEVQHLSDAKTQSKNNTFCKYFPTARGCKNGDSCRFRHQIQNSESLNTQRPATEEAKESLSQSPKVMPRNNKRDRPSGESPTSLNTEVQNSTGSRKRQRRAENTASSTRGDNLLTSAAHTSYRKTEPSDWTLLMEQTRSHPRFFSDYNGILTSDGQALVDAGDWKSTNPCGEWCYGLPHVYALDCEMCVVRNSDTGELDSRALIRVSLVDGNKPDTVLIDEHVRQPSVGYELVETKADIHGISQETIASATLTLRHAQAAMQRLVCDRSVIVGHSVHGDLKSLKLRHSRVVDTAYLYQLRGLPEGNRSPALKDVVKAVFDIDMPEEHDSCYDAMMSMLSARYELEHGPSKPIVRAGALADDMKLRVHHVPDQYSEADISLIFCDQARVKPTLVEAIKWRDSKANERYGTTVVTFLTSEHASLAYKTLEGPVNTDTVGREQKRVKCGEGGKSQFVQVARL